jgi:DNA polymerase-1
MRKSIIKTHEEFCEWFRESASVIALDTETTSLNYLDLELLGISLCDGNRACYIPAGDDIDLILDDLDAWLKLSTVVMHNAVFDLKVLRKYGVYPHNIFCTLTGAKLIDENLPSHSLKYLALDFLNVPVDEIKKWEEVAHDPNSQEFMDYAINDAIWTYKLWKFETKEFKEEGVEYIAAMEMDFQRVLVEMEVNGISVDNEKLEVFKDECGKILIDIESSMLGIFGKNHVVQTNLFGGQDIISPINFGSSPQLIDCVHRLGFVVDEKTKKGNPSVGKVYLQKMKGEHEFFDLLWRYRKLEKLYNSFLEPLHTFIDSDGRIRPSYQMVRTGRLSCSKPNLQQLPNPKKEKLEFNHREIFIPAEGNVLVKADYSGQELRVLGEVANDFNILDAFNRDYDLHLFTANRVFNLGLSGLDFVDGSENHRLACEEYSGERYQTKSVNFGIVYGQTVKGLAKALKISLKEAQKIVEQFFELYPGVEKAIDLIPTELSRYKFVRTLFGRKRRFPDYSNLGKYEKSAAERQAFNFKIQGASADIGKIAGILLLKSLPVEAKIILFVHDEWVVECPKDMAEEVAQIMKECMEQAVALRVKMVVETKIVENFGE